MNILLNPSLALADIPKLHPDLLQTYIPGLKSTPHCPANREVENALIAVGIPLELPGPDAVDRAILNASGKTVYLSGNPTLH